MDRGICDRADTVKVSGIGTLSNVTSQSTYCSMLITRIRPSIWVVWMFRRSENSLMPRLIDTRDGVDLECSHDVPRVEQ